MGSHLSQGATLMTLRDILQCRAIPVTIGSIADIGWQPVLGHSVANDPEQKSCDGTNPRIWISLSLVVTHPRGQNAATRWKRATGQGPARE
jgi:hypothetical protein